jgi:hypothetical protein
LPTLSTLKHLFKAEYVAIDKAMTKFKRKDAIAIRKAADTWSKKHGRNWSAIILIDSSGKCTAVVQSPTETMSEEEASWFQDTGFKDYALQDIAIARAIEKKLSLKAARRDSAIDKIFG